MAIRSVLRGMARRPPRGATPLELDGSYSVWADALAASSGYDSEAILEKTRIALLKVKNGEKPYERDSVVFDEIEYSWPVLSGLLWTAAQNAGALDVLDFGGSLGSTYFQNRAFLASLPSVRWNVVDQPRHVATGKKHFEDGSLHFYETIDACLGAASPNVVLLSSVLQYVEHPEKLLEEVSRIDVGCLIIDRTSFWSGPDDRLFVQTVPASIYAASYPIWVFSTTRFQQLLESAWDVVAGFDSLDKLSNPVNAVWRGMILKRKQKPDD